MSLRNFLHFFSTTVPYFIFLMSYVSSVPTLANGTEGYIIKGTKVEYQSTNEAGKPVRMKLRGVQTDYFKILSTPDKPAGPFVYGKDLLSVFYKGTKLEGADPLSFEVLCGGYAKDNQAVYYQGTVLPEALPAAFGVLGWSWAKDASHVYKDGQVVAYVKDPASFELLTERVSKDASHVYLHEEILKDVEPSSFTLLGRMALENQEILCYFKDRENVFISEQAQDKFVFRPIEGAEALTFEVLKGNGYARDSYRVYYKHRPLIGADPENFRILPDGYSKDQRRIYFQDRLLENAHAPTFLVMRNKHGAKLASDEFNVYYEDMQIEGANPRSFKLLNKSYYTDNVHIFHKSHKVARADLQNLKIYAATTAAAK